jgi:hypothetical protein
MIPTKEYLERRLDESSRLKMFLFSLSDRLRELSEIIEKEEERYTDGEYRFHLENWKLMLEAMIKEMKERIYHLDYLIESYDRSLRRKLYAE